MSMYTSTFFDEPIDRIGTDCEKWDGLRQRENAELLPMWVADMDFRCADEIVEALVKRASHPVYGYTDATDAAVEAMLGFMERRHGLHLKPEQQLMLPCVISGLRAAVLTLTEPGEGVIVQSPVYGPFYASVRENGRKVIDCPLIREKDGGYQMDLNAVEDACQKGAKLMFLCNPHNPVGRAWSKTELLALWNVLNRYGVTLVSDEIHEDFAFEPMGITPMLALIPEESARLLSLTSASKTFNLAGLQQAVLFTRNQELKKKLADSLHRVGVVQGNIFAMTATEAAFRYGDAWLDGLIPYLKEGEKLVRRELEKRLPEAVFSPMNATYLGWMDLRAYGFGEEELMKRTHQAGVAFTGGTFFGSEEGFLRINFACPHSQTLNAMERLEKAIIG
ncbi:MAG: PatB family C-S lyase [Eubacteriales bacterium]|nr:PatB family C-S lyase [Eubacteriales bacterium]